MLGVEKRECLHIFPVYQHSTDRNLADEESKNFFDGAKCIGIFPNTESAKSFVASNTKPGTFTYFRWRVCSNDRQVISYMKKLGLSESDPGVQSSLDKYHNPEILEEIKRSK